jgi:hypothetical protein
MLANLKKVNLILSDLGRCLPLTGFSRQSADGADEVRAGAHRPSRAIFKALVQSSLKYRI